MQLSAGEIIVAQSISFMKPVIFVWTFGNHWNNSRLKIEEITVQKFFVIVKKYLEIAEIEQ